MSAQYFLVLLQQHGCHRARFSFWLQAGIENITGALLAKNIEMAISPLFYYGSIVDTADGNGTSENQLSNKTLATISARDILLGTFTEEELKIGVHASPGILS